MCFSCGRNTQIWFDHKPLMALLDFGPIYTDTGSIVQLEYAEKCASNSNTILAIKYKTGIILASENPVESLLYKPANNIKELSKNIAMLYTGLPTDGKCIYEYMKDVVYNEFEYLDDQVSPGFFKKCLSQEIHSYCIYMGCRPVGCSFISALSFKEKLFLLGTTCDSKTTSYRAIAYGKGAQRCRTELEKLDIENLSLNEAIENAVRILYKAFDPLKDKEFKIEISSIDIDTNHELTKIDDSLIMQYVDVYKDLSVDE